LRAPCLRVWLSDRSGVGVVWSWSCVWHVEGLKKGKSSENLPHRVTSPALNKFWSARCPTPNFVSAFPRLPRRHSHHSTTRVSTQPQDASPPIHVRSTASNHDLKYPANPSIATRRAQSTTDSSTAPKMTRESMTKMRRRWSSPRPAAETRGRSLSRPAVLARRSTLQQPAEAR
jgi:hypothetical protein